MLLGNLGNSRSFSLVHNLEQHRDLKQERREHGLRRIRPIEARDGTVVYGGKHKHLSTPVTWTRIVEESIAFVTIIGKMSFREFRELLILLYGDNIVQMKSFYCFTITSKQKVPNSLMETTSNSIWILRTPPNAKQSFVSRSKASLALSQHSDYHQC